jgi:3-methyladenine DNA glycosylase/8-oxoguanine DNA glycosylase
MTIQIPAGFNLQTTINSHGWYDLPPFRTNDALTVLDAVLPVSPAKHLHVSIREAGSVLTIGNVNRIRLTKTEKERIKNIVRSMLRMDEDLTEFYSLCRTIPHLRWVPKRGAGRILRSPTVFEDVVKMMFTTNCSWALTKIQTAHLTVKLGKKISDDVFAFPAADTIARRTDRWLRSEISCGYRAPYLLKLCRDVANNTIELESMKQSDVPTEELYRKLRSIKGIGHYAAGNILKLLGRYDYLGIDSWVRTRFSQIHKKGRTVSDAVIEKHYDRYGKWRGLVCLMEVTSDWHR